MKGESPSAELMATSSESAANTGSW